MSPDKSSRIVVTGGNGFLGSSVMNKLALTGYTNINTFSSKEFDLRYQNIASRMFSVFNPDVVIHLAASVGGIGANMTNPGKFCYDNLVMGTNVIELCRLFNVKKLIIAATICGYPLNTPVPFKEADLWNGFPSSMPEPTNSYYGLAKKMLMVLADGYRKQYGLNSITLFPVNLYGKGDHFDLENSHVIPAMIRKFHEAKINNHQDVILWGDGSPTREFLYVDDCADAFIAAMERYDAPDPINIGSGKEISMLELANKIQAIVGHDGKIIWDKSRPNGQPRRCLDVSLAKTVLDWQATTEFNEGLRNTYNWFLSQSGNSMEK